MNVDSNVDESSIVPPLGNKLLEPRDREAPLALFLHRTKSLSFANMDAPKADTVVPVNATEKPAASEQEINPWDVQAARDEQGNSLAFDYAAIAQYVCLVLDWNNG